MSNNKDLLTYLLQGEKKKNTVRLGWLMGRAMGWMG